MKDIDLDVLRQRYSAAFSRALDGVCLDLSGPAPSPALVATAAGLVVSAPTFVACRFAMCALLKLMRISSSSLLSLPAGVITVALSANAAYFGGLSASAFVVDKDNRGVTWFSQLPRGGPEGCFSRRSHFAFRNQAPGGAAYPYLPQPSLPVVLSTAFCGVAIFGLCARLAGGLNPLAALRGLCPSNLFYPGSFARPAAAVPCTGGADYASPAQRVAVRDAGRRFGCHSCGVRPATPLVLRRLSVWLRKGPGAAPEAEWVADHQPCNKFVHKPLTLTKDSLSRENFLSALWLRTRFRNSKQLFFPHCLHCSNLQGQAVRLNQTTLVMPRRLSAFEACGLLPWSLLLHPHSAAMDELFRVGCFY
jgi:hypothetical protein